MGYDPVTQENHRYSYNYRQIRSTTGEVLYFRFQRALEEKKSLFREFKIKHPYQSVKDIFCLRANRTVDPNIRISINNLELKVNGAIPRETVNLRIYPLSNGISEVRFWCKNTLIGVQRIKNNDLGIVQF